VRTGAPMRALALAVRHMRVISTMGSVRRFSAFEVNLMNES
jgi:hypothetical protein